MKRKLKNAAFLAMLLCTINCPLCFAQTKNTTQKNQAQLIKEVKAKIEKAVFEVIVPKPKEENLVYMYDLPFEFIDDSIRNDKYLPVATAFLADDGLFYSASAPFKLLEQTQYGPYYIRDHSGNVYKIDQVESFATNRGFIAFKAEGFDIKKAKITLKMGAAPGTNTKVFTAAYELGDGLVVRTGSVTAKTDESVNAEWKWFRYSATAAPKTSGGPLVNQNGEVLGIIVPQQNTDALTYALPFTEVHEIAPHTGEVIHHFDYAMPSMNKKKFAHKFYHEVALPKSLETIQKTLRTGFLRYRFEIAEHLVPHFGAKGNLGFLYSSGSSDILSSGTVPAFPLVVGLSNANKWVFQQPQNIYEENLEDGGGILFGGMMSTLFAVVKKPDDIPFEKFCLESSNYIDYMLMVNEISRTVAGEAVPIMSFGKALKVDNYQDAQGRTWYIDYWNLPFADSMAVSYALPLPEGIFVMLAVADTDTVTALSCKALEFEADCVYPRYVSSLKNWKDFLAFLKKSQTVYPPFDNLTLNLSDGNFSLKSPVISAEISKNIFEITDRTTLGLGVAFELKDNLLQQKVRSLELYTNRKSEDYKYVHFSENIKPEADARPESITLWKQKINKGTPYTGTPYNQNNFTFYDEIIFEPEVKDRKNAARVFLLSCEMAGTNKVAEMKAFAEELKKNIKIGK